MFFVMLVMGVILGMLYDVFRVKRRLFGSNALVLFFDDLIFSMLALTCFLFTVFVVNNGIFRWFEVFFCLVGFCLYSATISKIVIAIFFWVADLLRAVVKKIIFVIFYPIRFAFKSVCSLMKPVINMYNSKRTEYKIVSCYSKLTSIGKCIE